MQRQARTEDLDRQWVRYRQSKARVEKTRMLEECAEVAGLSRDNLIRVFKCKMRPSEIPRPKPRGNPKYTDREKQLLALLWRRMGIWGSEKFMAAMPE